MPVDPNTILLGVTAVGAVVTAVNTSKATKDTTGGGNNPPAGFPPPGK